MSCGVSGALGRRSRGYQEARSFVVEQSAGFVAALGETVRRGVVPAEAKCPTALCRSRGARRGGSRLDDDRLVVGRETL